MHVCVAVFIFVSYIDMSVCASAVHMELEIFFVSFCVHLRVCTPPKVTVFSSVWMSYVWMGKLLRPTSAYTRVCACV